MRNKKADMGMGTLIIFIAMILVAAVAASVLIATTSKLQNKALDTGKLTTQEIGSGLQAVELYAEDGTNQNLEYFYETIKLAAGSDAIRFNDVLLTMSMSSSSQDYTYNTSVSCGSMTGINADAGYGVQYQINGSSHTTGYLNKGDVAKLCFASPTSVGESADVKFSIIPKVGSTLVVETTTPDLMVDKRVSIFP